MLGKSQKPAVDNYSSDEIKNCKVFNHTFNDDAFNKLYETLKGKVVETKLSGTQTMILTKSDLQRLPVAQLVITNLN